MSYRWGKRRTHLSSQDVVVQRTPGRRSEAVFFVERSVLLLWPLAVEHVVLALLHDGSYKVELVGDV